MSNNKSHRIGLFCKDRQNREMADIMVYVRDHGFNFVCTGPVLNEGYANSILEGNNQQPTEPFTWFDSPIPSSDWCSMVVGILHDVNDQLESDDPALAHRAMSLMKKEIEFTHHISLPSVIVELKRGKSYVNLARIVQEFASSGPHSQQFWVKVPMEFNTDDCSELNGDSSVVSSNGETAWMLWNKFRTLCNHEPKVFPSLIIPLDLPSKEAIKRWLGEPVRCIIISTNNFITNHKGFPVLPKHHQQVIRQFVEIGAQIVLDVGTDLTRQNLPFYRQYINFIQTSELQAMPDEYSGINFTSGYEDYLQCPLQPLQDNLESHTYEVFEKDPVKYELYADAVAEALLDMVSEDEKDFKTIVLMVVGAGRGPLVRSSFRAAERSGRKIRVYAIEKNMNAANTLMHLNEKEWDGKVNVINVDMREWEAPEQADLIVSELLGSFADNELSPECLDGAQKFLKPGGVMIPQSYRSYISPVMSSRLYNEVRRIRELFKNIYSHFETPYVVHMKNRYTIAEPQLVFTFTHPKKDIKETNERYTTLKFQAQEDCVLHGFGGYFECTLYGRVIMSILPKTFSNGMFSWFPIFFPIRDPVNISKGDTIQAHMWRCISRTSVWYEWTISSPACTPIHNPNGRSYTIGL